MNSYRYPAPDRDGQITTVMLLDANGDEAEAIPLHGTGAAFETFKADVAAGASLTDHEGNPAIYPLA